MKKKRCSTCEVSTEKSRDPYECYYCGLYSKKVEASGMFHCPNLMCTGPGAAWFRATLESFKESGNKHSVDPDEWRFRARKYLEENPDKEMCFINWRED